MNNDGLINICIFIGGCSVEHEISLISGLQTILNLDKSIYNPFVVYLSKDNEFIYLKDLNTIDYFKEGHHLKKKANCYFIRKNSSTYLVYKRKHFKIDICFPVVHGKGVEDGNLSGYINLLKLPNVCSNVLSSSIAQDKGMCKKILKTQGIRMCKWIELTKETKQKKIDKLLNNFNFPLIIKPSTLGSSIGIEIVNNIDELNISIENALKYDKKIIIEEKLTNFVEYNMACYKSKGILYPSLVEEVKTTSSYLTFNDKYTSGGLKETSKENRTIPAPIDESLLNEITAYTKTIYNTLGFNGVIRIDYLYDLNTCKLYFNEVNTIPGSLAFYLYKDYSFKELLNILIKEAQLNFNKEKDLINSFNTNILQIKDLKMKK